MSAWISSMPASGPGSGWGSGSVMAGFLHFLDILLQVVNGLLGSWRRSLDLLLTDKARNSRCEQQQRRHDQCGRPDGQRKRQRCDSGGDDFCEPKNRQQPRPPEKARPESRMPCPFLKILL